MSFQSEIRISGPVPSHPRARGGEKGPGAPKSIKQQFGLTVRGIDLRAVIKLDCRPTKSIFAQRDLDVGIGRLHRSRGELSGATRCHCSSLEIRRFETASILEAFGRDLAPRWAPNANVNRP